MTLTFDFKKHFPLTKPSKDVFRPLVATVWWYNSTLTTIYQTVLTNRTMSLPSAKDPPRKTKSFLSFRKRPGSSVRLDISLDLGCSNDEVSTNASKARMMAPEDEDTLFLQLEDGLFGTVAKPTGGRSGFFQRKVDRTESCDSTTDADHFLWSSDGDALTPDSSSK